MPKANVLSVDDDKNLQVVVQHYLEGEGYNVTPALNGKETESHLAQGGFDIVLLDLVLPDTEGLSLISKIRMTSKVPVIIISGKSDTTEKIIGLEMGADDYMTKPFELRELSARIRAVLRRREEGGAAVASVMTQKKESEGSQRICFSGWCLDRLQYQLFDSQGNSAELTAGEFRLLEALVLSPQRVLTRDYLFELTRESEFEAFDRAIDIQIGRLRKKLQDDPKEPHFIKTVRGVGYLFCGTIDSEAA
jgi:two-component system OmpR family response regulator